MRSFVNLAGIDKNELKKIINHAKENKKNKKIVQTLKGKTLIMIFEKKSLRTRISFELAMKQLGGDLLILNPKDSHYGSGDESIYDTAKIISQYGDIVMMRANNHKNFVKFQKNLDIPIINGLTNLSHPCQIMADIMTFEELKGSIKNKKIAWLGDGNNVVYSLIEASVKFNFKLAIASPKKFRPDKKILNWAKNKNAKILLTKDPREAASLADCIMTDKWVSMGDKLNKSKKEKILTPYQVNKKIMKLAKPNAIFMHCLPANRGHEVTNEVIDGKQSAVWLEALNRIYVQKSIIEWCLK